MENGNLFEYTMSRYISIFPPTLVTPTKHTLSFKSFIFVTPVGCIYNLIMFHFHDKNLDTNEFDDHA